MFRAKVFILASGLLAWNCTAKKTEPESAPVVTVDVAPVVNSKIQLKIVGDAVLYPLQQAAIAPKISAPIRKFHVDRGARVRAGQLLAELESQDLAGAVKESQAAYDQAEATYQTIARGTVPEEVQKAEIDVKAAKDSVDALRKIYDSRQDLYRQGALALKDVNESLLNLTQAQNQYKIAQAHLETLQGGGREQALKAAAAQRDGARAKVETAQTQLSYARITSPIDGVITDRPLFAGEMPPAGNPIITVMDLSQVVARAHISQEKASQLKVGDPANFIPPDAKTLIPGKITLISPALDPTNTTVEVWVQAANPGERLKPGTSLRVEMIAQTVASALVIPQNAVLTSPSGNTSVMVVDADNKPQRKSVTLGIRDGRNVQVTEGLASGERVVTIGAFELAKLDPDVLEKTRVAIQPPKEEDEEDQ